MTKVATASEAQSKSATESQRNPPQRHSDTETLNALCLGDSVADSSVSPVAHSPCLAARGTTSATGCYVPSSANTKTAWPPVTATCCFPSMRNEIGPDRTGPPV